MRLREPPLIPTCAPDLAQSTPPGGNLNGERQYGEQLS